MMPFPSRENLDPQILSGRRDQDGHSWICYGTKDRYVIFSIAELQTDPNAVFAKIFTTGKRALTNRSKDDIRREVEEFDTYEEGTVASCFGWTGHSYLYGDGSWFNQGSLEKVFFAPPACNSKAGCLGDLPAWQASMSPFAVGQPLVLFVISYSFVGPLLAFAPRDLQNTIVELVGPREKGKSTLGICAGSVWGGHADSSCGFGESWNLTPGAIDEVMAAHRDQLLYLEEANLAGPTDVARAEFLRAAIFRMTNTDPRKRLNDPSTLAHVRTAVLSTSNVSLRKLINPKTDGDEAALSRILTVYANRPYGIFDTVPAGFASAGAAVRAMHGAAASCYGVAGRHFIQSLIEWSKRRCLSQDVSESFEKHLRHPSISRFGEGRQAKILAIVCATHEAAAHFRVLPREWGSITRAIETLRFDVHEGGSTLLPALEQLIRYIQDRSSSMTDVRRLIRPLSGKEWELSTGIWTNNDRLLIPTNVFHDQFREHRVVLQELRASSHLETEGGSQPKLSKKVPAAVCADHGRRAYFFRLPQDRLQAQKSNEWPNG